LCVITKADGMGEAGRRGRVQPITRTMGEKWTSPDPVNGDNRYGRGVLFGESAIDKGVDEREVVSTGHGIADHTAWSMPDRGASCATCTRYCREKKTRPRTWLTASGPLTTLAPIAVGVAYPHMETQ
jgi:hypothetical protein